MEQVIDLHFDEPSHKYTIKDTGEEFTSVTTVIGNYAEEFDNRYWSMWTGLKNAGIKVKYDKKNVKLNKITVSGIPTSLDSLYQNSLYAQLARATQGNWKDTTEKSHIRGNKIHNYLEDTINESRGDKFATDNEYIRPINTNTKLTIFKTKNDLDSTDLATTYPSIYFYLCELIDKGFVLIAEKKIYTVKYMIAGMIDVLAVNHSTKEFMIVDWKSNKDKMHFVSGYYPKIKTASGSFVKGTEFKKVDKRLDFPLDNLQNCKGIKYTLQLSLYAFIMELWGYKLTKNGLAIFHIRPRRKPLLLKIEYLKADINRMLEHFNQQRINKKNGNTPQLGFGITG